MAAEYPAVVTTNLQNVANDGAADITKAQAADINKVDENVKAIADDLKAAFDSESAANIAAMIAAMRVDIDAGGGGTPTFAFSQSDGMTNPGASEFPVNAASAVITDSNNNALLTRRFTDASEQGVALFPFRVPAGVTSVKVQIVARAEVAPGGAETVRTQIYSRKIPDNAATPAFSAGTLMTALDIPTNDNWQYDEQTFTLATLGLVAGELAHFEITRVPGDGSDTLTGNWNLLEVNLEFS